MSQFSKLLAQKGQAKPIPFNGQSFSALNMCDMILYGAALPAVLSPLVAWSEMKVKRHEHKTPIMRMGKTVLPDHFRIGFELRLVTSEKQNKNPEKLI